MAYPTIEESLSKGMQLGREDVQNIETARYAPQTAIAKLAQDQAQATVLGQKAELGKYDVEAAGLIKQAMTPVGPSQDYSAIYSQTSSLKQKQDLAKQKLAKAEQLRNATMASGKFSESTRKAYEDAQAEVKSVDTEFKTFQAESLRKVLDPALTARDQSSWDMAKPQLAEATAEAAVQEAIKSGVPEENLARLRNDVRSQTLTSLPKAWGESAQNFVRSKAAELKSLEASNKMDKQVRDEEEHKMKMKVQQVQIEKTRTETDKALREAREGNPKAVADSVKLLKDIVNTESLELNRITADEEMAAKKQMEDAEEAKGSWFGDKTAEESNYQTAKANYDNIQVRKANAQKILDKAQSDLKLTLEMAKETGTVIPKDTTIKPKAITDKAIEDAAKQSWGSYEPGNYDYRVSPEGKLQRKAK